MRVAREKAYLFSIIHFIIILQQIITSSSTGPTTIHGACQSSACGGPNYLQIRFPFRLKNQQPNHCGYPGFELSCTSNNETVIELPLSGKFLVRKIDYTTQSVEIYDQNGCIPRRLKGFNLFETPFKIHDYENYTFLNCSRNVVINDYRIISCLSSSKYKVVYFHSNESLIGFSPNECKLLADSIKWPWKYGFSSPLEYQSYDYQSYTSQESLSMNWEEPNCGRCESHGGNCGYNTNLSIRCTRVAKGVIGKEITISLCVGLFVFVLSVLIILVKMRNKANKEEKKNQLRIQQFLENNALKPTRYSHADLKKITNKFGIKLGEGGYGSVFEGKLTNGIQVAVKVLDNSNPGSNDGEEFINAIVTIGRIYHLNIVRLLGFCVEGSIRALIYEFMSNSSLDKFIFSAGKDKTLVKLNWKNIQEIAIGIARGIEYLHQGCDHRILHFDIKPQNILLDHNFTPKISDFGLAKLCTKDTFVTVSMAAARGTMGYIAPEVFSRNFGMVSNKSDVYSFGMLLLEMVGGKKNNKIKTEECSDEEYFPEWVYNRLNRGENLGIQAKAEDLDVVKKLIIVALWCIQWNPIERPSMNAVLHMLEGNTENLVMASNPFASTTSVFVTSGVDHTNEIEITEIIED